MKWAQRSPHHWVREDGRYFIERTLSVAENPLGQWIYLAWFKRSSDAVAEDISPQRRFSLESARGDCAVHLRSQQQLQQSAAA